MNNTLDQLESRLEAFRALESRLESPASLENRSTGRPGHISVPDAVELINSMVFMPEWEWIAEDYTKRFQGGIKVSVLYQARNSDRDQAPSYQEWTVPGGRASFVMQINDCVTKEDVLRKLIVEGIMPIFLHETREFLRYPDTLIAPFHPHNQDTMEAWGSVEHDLKFGAA